MRVISLTTRSIASCGAWGCITMIMSNAFSGPGGEGGYYTGRWNPPQDRVRTQECDMRFRTILLVLSAGLLGVFIGRSISLCSLPSSAGEPASSNRSVVIPTGHDVLLRFYDISDIFQSEME